MNFTSSSSPPSLSLMDLQAQQQQIAEHIPAAFAMFDDQMRYMLVNTRWREAYGLGDRELIGHSHYDVFPEIGENWKDIHRRCLNGESSAADEAPFLRADGSLDWIKWDIRPWYRADGTIGGLLMYTDVITEQVNNRRELANQASLFSQGSAVVFRWRAAEGLPVEYASRSLTRFGYEPEELTSGATPYSILIHPDDMARVTEDMARYTAAGQDSFDQEYRIVGKDGRVYWVYALTQAIRDAQGNATHYYGYVLDVTRLHEEEEARSILQARYTSLVENNDDYITVVDLQGNIQFVNRVAPEVAAMFYGKPLAALVPTEQAQVLNDALQKVKHGEVMTYTGPGQRRNGQDGFFATRIMPIERNGEIVGMTILSTDITELDEARKEREKLIADLRVANRMAQENARLKSEFLSTMSHELRTPLNAIEGFTSIMLSDMGIELSSSAYRMVERVSANSKRLLNLINDFLDLSRIESGRMELVHTALQPSLLAERWREQIAVLAEDKGLRFEVEVDRTLPVLVGDDEALTKVAVNLLSNAIKFTQQGHVILRLRRAADDLWQIEVEDSGIGIPPHAREYIFDEFRQVDQSSKRLYGGTGLGLAIVQKLARLMGGTVAVQSEVGRGSTFTVTLPLVRAGK